MNPTGIEDRGELIARYLEIGQDGVVLPDHILDGMFAAYLGFATRDLTGMLSSVFDSSRLIGHTTRHEIRFSVDPGSTFGAYIGAPSVRATVVKPTITLGAFLALDDLFHRLAANADFFVFSTADGRKLWSGCPCVWFSGKATRLPTHRFYDYSQRVTGAGGTPLSGVYEVLPFDEARLKLAQLLLNVAITWVILHEESHYIQGHLGYLQAAARRDGRAGPRRLMLDETGGAATIADADVCKVIEWEADREATRGTIDVWFQKCNLDLLPDYCDGRKEDWLLRLIFCAIGATIQIIQKARHVTGADPAHYPSARTRLVSMFYHALHRLDDPTAPVHRTLPPDQGTVRGYVEWKYAIGGALDDLNTVSSLINREVVVGAGEHHPIMGATRKQSLVDTRTEAIALLHLIPYQGVYDAQLPRDSLDPAYAAVMDRLSEKWFSEVRSIVRMHREVWDRVESFRAGIVRPAD